MQVGDNSILMPNNHSVEIKDREDGTCVVAHPPRP